MKLTILEKDFYCILLDELEMLDGESDTALEGMSVMLEMGRTVLEQYVAGADEIAHEALREYIDSMEQHHSDNPKILSLLYTLKAILYFLEDNEAEADQCFTLALEHNHENMVAKAWEYFYLVRTNPSQVLAPGICGYYKHHNPDQRASALQMSRLEYSEYSNRHKTVQSIREARALIKDRTKTGKQLYDFARKFDRAISEDLKSLQAEYYCEAYARNYRPADMLAVLATYYATHGKFDLALSYAPSLENLVKGISGDLQYSARPLTVDPTLIFYSCAMAMLEIWSRIDRFDLVSTFCSMLPAAAETERFYQFLIKAQMRLSPEMTTIRELSSGAPFLEPLPRQQTDVLLRCLQKSPELNEILTHPYNQSACSQDGPSGCASFSNVYSWALTRALLKISYEKYGKVRAEVVSDMEKLDRYAHMRPTPAYYEQVALDLCCLLFMVSAENMQNATLPQLGKLLSPCIIEAFKVFSRRPTLFYEEIQQPLIEFAAENPVMMDRNTEVVWRSLPLLAVCREQNYICSKNDTVFLLRSLQSERRYYRPEVILAVVYEFATLQQDGEVYCDPDLLLRMCVRLTAYQTEGVAANEDIWGEGGRLRFSVTTTLEKPNLVWTALLDPHGVFFTGRPARLALEGGDLSMRCLVPGQ